MNYEFEVLDFSDERLVMDAAECLAETFTGVTVGQSLIQEPMSIVVQINKEDHQEFVLGYLKSVMDQGLCFVAKDQSTGKVIGALACESYKPNEEPPVFEGKLESMNKIIDFLEDLDRKFKEVVHRKTGAPIKDHQYIHMFMIGVRAEKNKRHVANEMMRMLMKKAADQGYKGLFGEATNTRCQMMVQPLGFYVPMDIDNQPLHKLYAADETFKEIPEDIARECALVYLELDPAFDLRS